VALGVPTRTRRAEAGNLLEAKSDVTLAVVTRDRPRLLERWALPGLLKAVGEGWQVLVVDQSTGEETRQLCDGLEPDFMRPIWDGFRLHTDVAAVLGRGRWPETGELMPGGRSGVQSWPVDPLQLGSGYNFGVRVAACREVGDFDTALGPGTRFCGGDDIEMIVALLLAGRRVVCTDRSVVVHPEWRTRRGEIRRQFGYGGGTALVVRKHWRQDPRLLYYLARRAVRQGARISDAAQARQAPDVVAGVAYAMGLIAGGCSGPARNWGRRSTRLQGRMP
jgi:hypothetical protein